ncbi:MAG: hypothetical protein JNL30_15605 [Rubrivivax sp.]|nr:hypothetical protein [Rubrivivax sp.]
MPALHETFAARWYAAPVLIAALMAGVFLVGGHGLADESTQAARRGDDARRHAMLLAAPPQPGEGEPVLVPGEAPPSH